jgi:hypothetical protein
MSKLAKALTGVKTGLTANKSKAGKMGGKQKMGSWKQGATKSGKN